MTFVEVVDFVARGLEGAGVAVIVIGALVATVLAIRPPGSGESPPTTGSARNSGDPS